MEFLIANLGWVATVLTVATLGSGAAAALALLRRVKALETQVVNLVDENLELCEALGRFENEFLANNRRVADLIANAEVTVRQATKHLTSAARIPAGRGFGTRPTGRSAEFGPTLRARREIPVALKGADRDALLADTAFRTALTAAARALKSGEELDENTAIEVATAGIADGTLGVDAIAEVYATFRPVRDRLDAERIAKLGEESED